MIGRKGGKIINIGSMYSFFGSGLIPSYSAAKGAIIQLTKSMAIELAPHNIQVNAIAPGWIETDMTAPVHSMPLNDEILARTPAVDGVKRKKWLELPYTWPRVPRILLPVLRFASTVVMRFDDMLGHTQDFSLTGTQKRIN